MWLSANGCCWPSDVLRLCHMGHTLTVRLTPELADWLLRTSARARVPQGRIVRDQLEKARASDKQPGYMRLAGSVAGARDLSSRKGFTR